MTRGAPERLRKSAQVRRSFIVGALELISFTVLASISTEEARVEQTLWNVLSRHQFLPGVKGTDRQAGAFAVAAAELNCAPSQVQHHRCDLQLSYVRISTLIRNLVFIVRFGFLEFVLRIRHASKCARCITLSGYSTAFLFGEDPSYAGYPLRPNASALSRALLRSQPVLCFLCQCGGCVALMEAAPCFHFRL